MVDAVDKLPFAKSVTGSSGRPARY